MVGALSAGGGAAGQRWAEYVQPGKVLCVIAPPMSQSEALIRMVMDDRPTTYVTTVRRREAVEAALEVHAPEYEDVDVVGVDETTSMDAEFVHRVTGRRADSLSRRDDAVLDETYEAIAAVEEEPRTVVVDTVNPLEQTGERTAYTETLNLLKSTVLETGGVGVLHCLASSEPPPLRDVTLNVADVAWRLEVSSDGNGSEYQLTIPKNRGGATHLDPISLVVGTEVVVDESRNI